ncbi:MAG: BlaI/MecI/CopY family transcriptional regulator [Armatimonadota bacterium]
MTTEAVVNYRTMKVHHLGELEAQILDIVWDIEPPVSIPQVFKIMYQRRGLAYPTISQTLEQLAKKGLLIQTRLGTATKSPYTYTPTIPREELAIALLNAVSHQVLGKPLDEGIVMLCGGKLDAKGMERLKELVAEDEAVEA